MSKHRVLVVANRGVDSPDLIEGLRQRGAVDSACVTLLVPAVPRGLAWAADMKAGWVEAMDRAELAAERMRAAGIEFDGAIVGDPDPFAAVGDVLHSCEFDEVLVAAPPPGLSGFLRPSLTGRLRRQFALPIAELTIRPPEARPAPRRPEPVGAAS